MCVCVCALNTKNDCKQVSPSDNKPRRTTRFKKNAESTPRENGRTGLKTYITIGVSCYSRVTKFLLFTLIKLTDVTRRHVEVGVKLSVYAVLKYLNKKSSTIKWLELYY